jgi:hypothetical protein
MDHKEPLLVSQMYDWEVVYKMQYMHKHTPVHYT